MEKEEFVFQHGLPDQFLAQAVALYDEAFGQKFSVAIPDKGERISFLEACLNPDYAIVAIAGDVLAGVAGYHTAEGSFTGNFPAGGAGYKALVKRLGVIGGSRAAVVLSLYERHTTPGELLMDGIAVNSSFRGQGIGSRLLDEITAHAADHGFNRVRLDVIDTNPRAKQLYERKGFTTIATEEFPYLKWLLGFSSTTTMVRPC